MMKICLKPWFLVLMLLGFLLFPVSGVTWAKDGHETHGPALDPEPHKGHADSHGIMTETLTDSDVEGQVRIDEQLGSVAALDTVFTDETGRIITLGTLFDKPVVILPIFFNCTAVCSFLQADLARAMNTVDQMPGKDFNIITLSFSDDENQAHAMVAKRNYTALIQREFPLENWSYLTGDRENILRFTESIGYYFVKKEEHVYIHPSALVVMAEGGKIIRYLYGPNFLPFDIGMALNEAALGTPGISIKRGVMSFCFDYDPEKKTYVFKLFRITGTAILILLAGFIIFLLYPSKKRRGTKNPLPRHAGDGPEGPEKD